MYLWILLNELTNNSDFRKIALNIDLKSCQSKSFLDKLRFKDVHEYDMFMDEQLKALSKYEVLHLMLGILNPTFA